MATYDDPYNPIPRRLREPTPGYSQTRLPGTERTVVETPRGGFSPDPAPGLSERDLAPENYAMPFSPTRSMRYGPGDERDLGAPVVDPRSPSAPSPARWGRVTTRRVDPPKVPEPSELDRLLADDNTRISWKDYPSSPGEIRVPVDPGDGNVVSAYRVYSVGAADEIDAQIAAAKRRVADWEAAQKNPPEPRYVRMARDSRGGYAYTDAPAVPDQSTPRPLFSGVAGEDFEATRRRGEQVAKLMREQDGPFANPNDWNYVRSYGPRAAAQAVASGRASISGAPAELVAQERERFLRNRTTDLSISPQLRSAARDELAQIERDAAEERRREMWAAEQAARLQMAEGANAATVEAARLTADGQIRAAQAKAAADAAAAEAAGKGKPVQLDPESPGLYVDGTFWKNPAYNPKPVTAGGNGIGRWNPDTGSWDFEWPDKGGAKKAPVTLKPGESYFDPETKETFVAPGTDRISIEAEIAGWQSAYVKTDSNKARAEIEKRIDEARKRLAALGGGEAAPAATAPAPVAATAAPAAPAEPAPAPVSAPAQPAASSSPTGYRRWTPGA